MNLVQKYLIKELLPYFIVGNFVFMFLLLIEKLVSLADLFFTKNVPLLLLIETITYLLPSIFFLTIPLAGLLATLICFSRLSADSELIAMKAIGTDNKSLIKPLIYFGIFAALLNGLMGAYLLEKGSTLAFNNLNKIVENISISDLKENEMYTQIPNIILTVKKKNSNTDFEQLTIIHKKEGFIINALKGSIIPTGSRSIEMVFHNGKITMGDIKDEITTVSFKNISLNLPLDTNIAQAVNSPVTMSIKQLIDNIKNPKAAFELGKRISTPISSIIMILFGFSLGIFLSRSGKSFGVLIAIAIAGVYNALMIYLENNAGVFPINPVIQACIPLFLFTIILFFSLRKSMK